MLPRSTYRVQLNAGFTFDDLAGIADYLADLGISHVYCSPYLQAVEGSLHGYDIVNHNTLNAELGGADGYERMTNALDAAGIAHILDIVPNHVSIESRAWWDVLKHGQASPEADRFDIDWVYLEGKVCVPLLGDTLEACVEREEIQLERSGAEPVIRYGDHALPIAPETDLSLPIEDLLEAQNYWLVEWRRGNRNINYRRFFDVSELAGLQIQHDQVFEETHRLVLELIEKGSLQGLRVDHIDGLWDPEGYLHKLKVCAPNTPIWVEKVLAPSEELPSSWPVEGTTGYDFLNVVGGLFVDPDNEAAITAVYQEFTRESVDLDAIVHTSKLLVLRQMLIAEIKRLYGEVEAILGPIQDEQAEGQLMMAIAETIAAFDVYRTYVRPDGSRTLHDERLLLDAVEAARRRAPHIPGAVFESLADLIVSGEGGERALAFLMRFQQTTGPAMAKSFEDTVFYNFNRLVSLNEVGGDPGYFGVTVEEFHQIATEASADRPRSMLATATHDTKRGEDVRARIALLSEIPDAWAHAVKRFSEIGDDYRSDDMPDRNTEYLFYQTVFGAFPLDVERAWSYMQKVAREAKRHTSWLQPTVDYEDALEGFVRGILADTRFQQELAGFAEPLIEFGRINSLAQTLIKLTYPGIPDTYQGTELWDLSLVDPDNRRPVDHRTRRSLLGHVREAEAAELWAFPDDGSPKMLTLQRTLGLRQERPELFEGAYTPLEAEGEAADHVVAFLRGDGLAVVVPRLMLTLGGEWGDTTVPLAEGKWNHVLTDETIYGGNPSVGKLLSSFPVALLVRA